MQGEIEGSRFELEGDLERFLIYGSYPEVLSEPDLDKKRKILSELVSSYLFKDALALEAVRSPDTLLDVVKCLAFQMGSEVSINEVARTARTDAKTAAKYIDLLEKMFIIKKIGDSAATCGMKYPKNQNIIFWIMACAMR